MMAIQLEQVGYTYDARSLWRQTALQDISLKFKPGVLVGIAGTTGSGKSTLLQMFNGILKPTAGSLRVLDVNIRAGEKAPKLQWLRKRVGLVFQFPEQQLFAETVEQDLCFGPLNFGMAPAEALQQAKRAMELMGLDLSLLARSPFQLSGGQMRKVAIASVLATNPDILVLDEPTATLDPLSRLELLELLHRLSCEEGKTVIIVTHRMDELLPYADRWMIMQGGRAVFEGSVRELIWDVDQLPGFGLTVPQPIHYWRALADAYHLEDEPPCLSAVALANRLQELVESRILPKEEMKGCKYG